jgi:hypothetical protein
VVVDSVVVVTYVVVVLHPQWCSCVVVVTYVVVVLQPHCWSGCELAVSAPVVVVALHAPYITAHPIWSVPVVWHERWREGAPGPLAPAFCALNTARTKANTPASTRPNPASRATSTLRLRVTGICFSHNCRPQPLQEL